MAGKKEFLETLEEQNRTMQSWLTDVDREINSRNLELSALGGRRAKAIELVVLRMLPDLRTETLVSLEKSLPNFLTRAEARDAVTEERGLIADRLKDLFSYFNPATAKAEALRLQVEIGKEKDSLGILMDGWNSLYMIPNFSRLVVAGYGTPDYNKGWWQLGYYLDWRDADCATEASGKKDWAELSASLHNFNDSIANSDSTLSSLGKKLAEIEANEKLNAELESELQNVEGTVCEKLQTQLRSRLDSMTELLGSMAKPPEFLDEALEIDAKIVALRKDVNEVFHPRREKIQGELSKLQKIILTVSRSKQKSVPDEYLEKARASNRAMSSGRGYGSSISNSMPSVPVYHDDSWLETLIWYDLVTNHYHSSDSVSQANRDYPYAIGADRQASEETHGRIS